MYLKNVDPSEVGGRVFQKSLSSMLIKSSFDQRVAQPRHLNERPGADVPRRVCPR